MAALRLLEVRASTTASARLALDGESSPVSRNELQAWGTSNIFAVGSKSGQPLIMHYDGVRWREDILPTPLPAGSLRGIWGRSADDITVVGDRGVIFQLAPSR